MQTRQDVVFKRNVTGLVVGLVFSLIYLALTLLVFTFIFYLFVSFFRSASLSHFWTLLWSQSHIFSFLRSQFWSVLWPFVAWLLISLVYAVIFLRLLIQWSKQPSRVTVTADGEVYIGGNPKACDGEVSIDVYKKGSVIAERIIGILLLGIIPGILYYLGQGYAGITFFYGEEKYTLHYPTSRNKNIVKYFKLTEDAPTEAIEPVEAKWRKRLRRRVERVTL